MKVSVIISTYNNPKWLEKTLYGYVYQTQLPNEVIIADDGSKEETKELIEKFKQIAPFPIKYVWHEDNGFRKCVILNKAIRLVEGDYVIFGDQDCVPREDYVETHCRFAQKNRFVSGGVVKLNMEQSEAVSKENIASKQIFDIDFLKTIGYKTSIKSLKLTHNKFVASFMNFITPANASWNGGNSSCWLSDIVKANGYNNKMVYGGEDRELGERMMNMGNKGVQARYSVIMLHLDHSRPYKDEQLEKANKEIRRDTKKNKVVVTPDGLSEV